MKKKIIISLVLLIFGGIIYFGVTLGIFSYFTGLGTPYSYFQAKKNTKYGLLILYEQGLDGTIVNYINSDSIRLLYGFKYVHGGNEVSSSVIDLYNSVIEKEIHLRLGDTKWNEYLFKIDSIQRKKNRESPIH